MVTVHVHRCTSNTDIDRLLTIHKSAVISIFLHFVHGRYRTARSWHCIWIGMVKWNGLFRSDLSNGEKWSTSKGGPLFSKLFRLDRTDPFSFRPKFPEILVKWIAPRVFHCFAHVHLYLIKHEFRETFQQKKNNDTRKT